MTGPGAYLKESAFLKDKLRNIEVDAPVAADDGKYLKYVHSTPKFKLFSPSGSGDMLKSVYDIGDNGIVDNSEKVDGCDAGIATGDVFKIPAGIAEGDIFYVNASGNIVRLVAGTSGHFLKTQGASNPPLWAAGVGGVTTWLALTDTPGSFDNGKLVKSGAAALGFGMLESDIFKKDGSVAMTGDLDAGAGNKIKTATISERTVGVGVTIDGCLVKDGAAADTLKIKGKTVDDAAIGDDKILVYKVAGTKLVYETKPTGGGDMYKSTYDTDDDGIVDKAENVDDGVGNASTAANVKDAVDKKHEHSNKAQLDLVTDGDHDVRTDNPHSVTKTQVSLGNVTNDAQLKRAAGDINTFTEKGSPVNADIVIVEDSADSYNKKKVQVGNLPGGGGEVNTASNVGTAGVGVFKQKTGVDLEFKKINAGSNKITITDDTGNSELDVDVAEGNINHDNLAGFVAAEHVSLPNTIANVLSNHNLTNHPLSIIPTMNDAHIPNLETLSYGGAFATAQIPGLAATKITSGDLASARMQAHVLAAINASSEADKIDNAQLDDLPASKTTTGQFSLTRLPRAASGLFLEGNGVAADPIYNALIAGDIPSLAASKITSGTFDLARIPTPLTGKDADSVDGCDAGVATGDVFKIPAGIAQGDIFYVDASGNVVRLAAGTSGHFLKTQGAAANPIWAAGAAGVTTWLELTDTPSSFSGHANKLVKVNATPDALEFIAQGSGNGLDADKVDGEHASAFQDAITEITKTAEITFATTDQSAGKAFTITDFINHGMIKKVKFRANMTAGQLSTVSALVNDATGLAPADTSLAFDNKSGTFTNADYLAIDNEIVKIDDVDPNTSPITIVRAQKGTTASYLDDNAQITKLNNGFKLQLFKDSNKKPKEMVLELSALMTATGTTDAAISASDKKIELSADLKNVDNNDTVRIADTVSEEALVQHNTGDVATAAYDFILYVYDALAAHDSAKTVEKQCIYDIPVSYKSGATTLYGTIQLMEGSLAANKTVNIEIIADKYS